MNEIDITLLSQAAHVLIWRVNLVRECAHLAYDQTFLSQTDTDIFTDLFTNILPTNH